MDTGALWYRSVRDRCESLASTASPILHGIGRHPAWVTILLLLAQTRSSGSASSRVWDIRESVGCRLTAKKPFND
jgi:hypothetical protein